MLTTAKNVGTVDHFEHLNAINVPTIYLKTRNLSVREFFDASQHQNECLSTHKKDGALINKTPPLITILQLLRIKTSYMLNEFHGKSAGDLLLIP